MVIEVHRQKGNVSSRIGVSEPLIKFDAIKDGDLIFPEDMFQSKVSVAISNPICSNPLMEYFCLGSEKVVRPILNL
jgi:hypothetical protein